MNSDSLTPKDWTSFIALLVFNAGRQSWKDWHKLGTNRFPRPSNPASTTTPEGKLWRMGWEYESMRDLIFQMGSYLNDEIASLPTESRVRTMDQDTWGTGMYLRDMADELWMEIRK